MQPFFRAYRQSPAVLLAVLLLGPASTVSAQNEIYKVTDGDSVEFTDKPLRSGDRNRSVEKVELSPLNTAPAVKVPPKEAGANRDSGADAKPGAVPASVSISSPPHESTIAMGPGNFGVTATTSPELGINERLQLRVDGEPYGPAQTEGAWYLEGVLRGPHDLQVLRQDENGTVRAESDTVRVYVLRPSLR